MQNSIRLSLTYSFKGETFTPSSVIDLDRLSQDEHPNWHAWLAIAVGIDTYSYTYEVMREAELQFSEPTGLAVPYLDGDQFDLAGFLQARREAHHTGPLQQIARDILEIDDLNSEPRIRKALVQAYLLGKSDSQSAQ